MSKLQLISLQKDIDRLNGLNSVLDERISTIENGQNGANGDLTNVESNIIPSTNNSYNIGSDSKNFLNGYFNSINIGGSLEVSDTSILAKVDIIPPVWNGLSIGTETNRFSAGYIDDFNAETIFTSSIQIREDSILTLVDFVPPAWNGLTLGRTTNKFASGHFVDLNTETITATDSIDTPEINTGSINSLNTFTLSVFNGSTLTVGSHITTSHDLNIDGSLYVTGNVFLSDNLIMNWFQVFTEVAFGTSNDVVFNNRNSEYMRFTGQIRSSKSFIPYISGCDLGGNSAFLYPWNDIYSVNAVTVTSDLNKKQNITDEDLGLDFINKIECKKYQLIDGQSGRYHRGFIAQQIRDLLEHENIPTTQFAGYVHNPAGTGEDGKEYEESFALRYGEFISPMMKAIQELSNKLTIQEQSIQDLYQRIISLETENKRLRK